MNYFVKYIIFILLYIWIMTLIRDTLFIGEFFFCRLTEPVQYAGQMPRRLPANQTRGKVQAQQCL